MGVLVERVADCFQCRSLQYFIFVKRVTPKMHSRLSYKRDAYYALASESEFLNGFSLILDVTCSGECCHDPQQAEHCRSIKLIGKVNF